MFVIHKKIATKTDYLIIGQGLAGTWLAHFLTQLGRDVLVVDVPLQGAASLAASGIVNPVTGRRIVKTWRADTLLPFAQDAYRYVEKLTQQNFFETKHIIWLLSSIQMLNDFAAKSHSEDCGEYIESVDTQVPFEHLQPCIGYAQVRGFQVQVPLFLHAYRQLLEQQGRLIEQVFEYADLQLHKESIVWKHVSARCIVFCDGYRAANGNPFFPALPFALAKGEALLAHIPKLKLDGNLLKAGIFIAPHQQRMEYKGSNDLFWIGSNYEHTLIDTNPTESIKNIFLQQLEEICTLPVEVQAHLVGIRPTTNNRRPFIGKHPHYPQLALLNGLGTKGVSLAPFAAHQLAMNLVHNTPIDSELDVRQFMRE